jgi:hypothetical protein
VHGQRAQTNVSAFLTSKSFPEVNTLSNLLFIKRPLHLGYLLESNNGRKCLSQAAILDARKMTI